MRIAVSFLLVACPLVIAAGCFGGGGVDAPPPPPGSGGTGGTGGTGGMGGAGGVGGMGGVGGVGGAGGGASSSSSSSASSSSSSSSGMGGGGGAGGGGVVTPCPDKAGMVQVQAPAGGKAYCVDAKEVTNDEYLTWIESDPIPMADQQTEPCKTVNPSFAPAGSPSKNALPVTGVDWCDAYAYCSFNGKRLCGRVDGGALPWSADAYDATLSQWHNACSGGDTKAFPYGGTYDAAACNGKDKDPLNDKPIAVMSLDTCEGGFPGIYDISGNVWEWEDSCNEAMGATPADNPCRRRGGSATSTSTDLDCETSSPLARGQNAANTGFRCCYDIVP